jgi:ATP-dependent helicase HrpA
VVAEMVKTSRLFARTVARIDAGWLEELGGYLRRYTYSEPHWSKSRGEVRAYEQVSLFGLIIIPKRSVSYGPINRDESHRIFIQSALIEGEIRGSLPFLRHNQNLINKIAQMEDKIRRRGILVESDVLMDFYSQKLKGIYDVRTLKKLIKDKGGDEFLRLDEKDLILTLPEQEELDLFPDQLRIQGTRFPVSYKFAPGREEDGVTIDLPSSMIGHLPLQQLDWPVPGLLKEKVMALIKGLPKRYRKELVPVSKTVDIIMDELDQDSPSLLNSLSRSIYRRFNVDIPAQVWSAVELPEFLKTRVIVKDSAGKELISTRDLPALEDSEFTLRSIEESDAIWQKARKKWEKRGITEWNFGTLPQDIPVYEGFSAYPALEVEKNQVNIKLFQDQAKAITSHQMGVRKLFEIHLGKDLKHLKRTLTFKKDQAKGCLYFGGSQNVEEELYQTLLNRHFLKNIRTEKKFENQVLKTRRSILNEAKDLKDQSLVIIDSYQEIRQLLQTGEETKSSNRALKEFVGQIRDELDRLVPKDFIRIYALEKLLQIPRYLKALKIRWERGSYDPTKDLNKMSRIKPFIDAFETMTGELSPHSSTEKKVSLNEFKWMVEEFKISVFAPELKTLYPVSAKRLEEKIKEINRMV